MDLAAWLLSDMCVTHGIVLEVFCLNCLTGPHTIPKIGGLRILLISRTHAHTLRVTGR